MTASLIEYIAKTVEPKTYYDATVSEQIRWPHEGGSEPRIKCLFHEDKNTPSLHMNPKTGAWYCHGCQSGGNSIVSFQAQLHGITHNEAAVDLYHSFVRPTISDEIVDDYAAQLASTPSAMSYLTKQRGLSPNIILQYKLGFDGVRFTFPVRNEFGLWVNIKFFDPLHKKHNMPKMVNYQLDGETRKYGIPPTIYPISVLTGINKPKYVIFCEGELDTLLLLSMGFNAITMSAGVKSWAPEHNELFCGIDVIIAYDNDEAGNLYAVKHVLKNLSKIARRINRLMIPEFQLKNGDRGKDVTDWWLIYPIMRQPAGWVRAIKTSKSLVVNSTSSIEKSEVKLIPLDQASQSHWFNRRIAVEALVTGKDTAPYLLPSKYRARCNKSCDECPLAERADTDFVERVITKNDSKVLNLVDVSANVMNKTLLSMAGLPCKPNCQGTIDVIEAFNIEQLFLIPTLESSSSQYVMRSVYYVGHGLYPNRSYQFEGTTLAHPQDQHTTHIFDVAKPVQDEVETFALTDELKNSLKIFQPKSLGIMAHLMSIAEWQSRNVTKILERSDLHIAIDIAFHSVASFNFNGEYVKRAMIDMLVIGDTRCGKGYVTEGLGKFYRLGEIASGENCTFAGLIGGLQQIGTRWIITWGIIPLNHGRLVVIDEASSLSEKDVRDMSRVRSEGVAEINKIKRESTRANTRLIWLGNTRSGRAIRTYNSGIQAIKELIGANEDISRFDFAMSVATDEVPSNIINARRSSTADQPEPDVNKYSSELCRSLVLWAWSRREGQIVFQDSATDEIIKQSIHFGERYSATIPLVQAENIRIKIAKISAAIAARVFSTDEECERLIIKVEHVRCACEFLHLIYAKQSMAYDGFSKTANKAEVIVDKKEEGNPLSSIFDQLNMQREHALDGLLTLHRVTSEALADYVGDDLLAKTLIGDLVRQHCLTRIDNWYLKNPSFSKWLRGQVNGTTQGDFYGPNNNGNGQSVSPARQGKRGRQASHH